ncbi:TetR/AcrR family transcriptional regulator [Mycolicibacterium sp. 120266]|uniref:TetR/AcrR family transcriptional regulator n=1 Tax=Mycolicibacterium sp. 120266 TaxID=3090601 RepID=UPI00299CD85E|nr:TetR/AcrR family transcriptional regulator [Mycolicibacterium sp. 120266]MDX1875372.1 TetR/AcrR family transcriptional regulator [Mycolicibacterium sp. 120266]
MTRSHASEPRDFTAKGLATRERIVRAAADVLLQDGVAGFNVDKVRQAAAVSGSQITHYFTDRRDLLCAVVRRQADAVLDFHRQPELRALDTFEDWERWADLNVGHLHTTGFRGAVTYHGLAGRLAKSDKVIKDTLAQGYWRWISLLEDSIARMKSRRLVVDSVDPHRLAMAVVSLHQGAGMLAFAFREEWPMVGVTRAVVNHLRSFAADPADRKPRVAGASARRRPRVPHDQSAPAFTAKGKATRQRIVEGAAELILERGVHGTSLEDVRRAVGVSGSQLSHYFADKDDLTRQVVIARTHDVVSFHTQPGLGRLDDMKSLRAWAELCWSHSGAAYLRNGCVYGALAGELLEAPDDVLDDVAGGYDRWIDLFHQGLSAMRDRGSFGSDADPGHLATCLVAAHQGGALLAYITGVGSPYHAAVDAALDYVAEFEVSQRASRSKHT